MNAATADEDRAQGSPHGRGRFIVLEGVEGAGKSTQVRLLGEWLGARGIPHLVTREPGGTRLGEEIRRLLLLEPEAVPDRAELLLVLAARAALVETEIEPALRAGKIVIGDRFELSTLAYQGYGRKLDLDEVRALNTFATGGLRPDLTIVLEIPVAEGVARYAATRRQADRIEQAGTVFHERVGEAYRLLSDTEPGVARVDGGAAPGVVHEAVRAVLRARFPETFARETG